MKKLICILLAAAMFLGLCGCGNNTSDYERLLREIEDLKSNSEPTKTPASRPSDSPAEEPTPEPSEEPTATLEPSEEPTEEPQESGTTSGDLGDHHVEITGASLAKSYDDRTVIVITYAWTNNSEDTTSAMVTFKENAYQNGVQLDSAILLGDNTYDLTSTTKNIRPGTTIDIQNAYYLDSETSVVEFEISELFNFFSDDSIVVTFDPTSLS